jgi:hypothetical protein
MVGTCKECKTNKHCIKVKLYLKQSNIFDNSNINCSHLNYGGLHLNREGSVLLQNNIANILKSKD